MDEKSLCILIATTPLARVCPTYGTILRSDAVPLCPSFGTGQNSTRKESVFDIVVQELKYIRFPFGDGKVEQTVTII